VEPPEPEVTLERFGPGEEQSSSLRLDARRVAHRCGRPSADQPARDGERRLCARLNGAASVPSSPRPWAAAEGQAGWNVDGVSKTSKSSHHSASGATACSIVRVRRAHIVVRS
jgi:hypothetical protein